jgi:hypothetical protein
MFGDGEEPWVERDDAIRLHPLDSIPPNRGDQTHRVGLDLTIATTKGMKRVWVFTSFN